MTEDLERAAARGGLWSVTAEISNRASQSVVFFLLAGVLSPGEFGAAAVAFVCVQIVNSVTYAGLGSAVQVLGKDLDRDRAAVAAAVLGGAVGCVALAVSAGPLCAVLNVPEAAHLVRMVGLALPLAQTSEVLAALLARDLRFAAASGSVVVASLLSAAAGLTLAALGAGAEALVAQAVIQPGLRLLLLISLAPAAFRPRLRIAPLRELWVVGRNLLLGSTFDTAASNVDSLWVSIIAGAAPLGAYGLGYNVTALPTYVIGYATGRVALPLYSQLLRRGAPLRPALVAAIEATGWLAALPLGFLGAAGVPALRVLFGSTWDSLSGGLTVLSVYGWLKTMETASSTALIAMGDTVTPRRVQQYQLIGAVVLLPGLIVLAGITGAATAVAVVVLVGTSCSLVTAARRAAAPVVDVVKRMGEAALGGTVGGAAAWTALDLVPGAPGLAVAFASAIVAWGSCLVLLRRASFMTAKRWLMHHDLPGGQALEVTP